MRKTKYSNSLHIFAKTYFSSRLENFLRRIKHSLAFLQTCVVISLLDTKNTALEKIFNYPNIFHWIS